MCQVFIECKAPDGTRLTWPDVEASKPPTVLRHHSGLLRYPPDLNLVIARAIASLFPRASNTLQAAPATKPAVALPIAAPAPQTAPALPTAPRDAPNDPPLHPLHASGSLLPAEPESAALDREPAVRTSSAALALTRCSRRSPPPSLSHVATVVSTSRLTAFVGMVALSQPPRFLLTRGRASQPCLKTLPGGRQRSALTSPTTLRTAAERSLIAHSSRATSRSCDSSGCTKERGAVL
eukprot:1241896-Pleurochrysis_carterae.AAC.4